MPENLDQYQARLTDLRKKMIEAECDGYILPRTDAYQGEFLSAHDERIAWLTGFTGSAGCAVVLHDQAVVMSDSRYTIQLAQQVPAQLYTVDDSIQKPVGKWLVDHAQKGAVIGYDMWLFTPTQIEKIEKDLEGSDITLKALDMILLDHVWSNQPEPPCAQVCLFPDEIAGKTAAQKRQMIAEKIQKQNCEALLLSLGDSICWILNVRGADIDYSPLVQSYGALYADGRFDWFIDPQKVPREVIEHLGSGVRIVPPAEMVDVLREVRGLVWLDRETAPSAFDLIFNEVYDAKDPCILPKAMKTPTELDAMREAHIHDGVAIVRFLKWLDEDAFKTSQTEISIEEKLEEFRCMNAGYLAPSFPTISGYAENGAIVHYRATPKTDKEVTGDGLLLVDSGGQYRWGTTDITRTMPVGQPTDKMKEHYTRVLKGHIAVSMARFDADVTGKEIDDLARQYLQEVGLNYGHGTGHGVGCYLCVHEEATSISPRSDKVFNAGMVVSNEPGYYEEGAYGIRIENLIAVLKDTERKDGFVFETLTLAPYAPLLVDMAMLDADEMNWLMLYQDLIEEKLSPYLSEEEAGWLSAQRIV